MQNHKTNSLLKLVIIAVLSMMLLFSFILPASVFSASNSKYESIKLNADADNELQVTGLKTSYTLGDTVTLPVVAEASATVTDPKNNLVALDASGNSFVASVAGDYTVVYTKNNTTTGEIIIHVKAAKPAFNFETNSQYIIPSEIAKDTTVTFPNPEIKDEDGEVIEGAVTSINIKKAGSTDPITLIDAEGIKSYKFTSAGVYYVTYSYSATGMTSIYKQYTIEVEDGYTSNVDLTFELDGSMPSSMVQGVEVELPKAIGKDKNNSNATVNVYTTVTAEHLNEDGSWAPEVVSDFKYTPKLSGTYRFTYKVVDFYGHAIEKTYDAIENVRDSKAPVIKIVSDYTLEADGTVSQTTIDALTDLSEKIPSVVGVGTAIELPAIYAEDNVASYKDLTLKRLIKNGSDQIANLDDTSVEEYTSNKPNQKATYTFTEAGTYTVIYKASDKSSNTTSDSLYSFTVVVKDSLIDTVAPTITVKDFIKNDKGVAIDEVEAGQTIRVVKPTVVDYADPDDPSNKDVVDTRPTLKVFAKIGADDEVELTLSEDGTYYEYTLPEAPSANSLKIRYVASDCNGNSGNGTTPAGLEKTIDIANASESVVPTIDNVVTSFSGDQYETIDINGSPNITVSDSGDRNVRLDINVTLNGQKVELDKFTTMLTKDGMGGSTLTVTDAKFTANKAGTYIVNYVAYDHSGNFMVKTATVTVASKAIPVIAVDDYETEMELGSAYVPKAQMYVDGEIDSNATISTSVEGDINKIGTVNVTYTGNASVSGIAAEKVTITITIKDSVAPTLIVDGEVPAYAELVKEETNPNQYKEITIPGFSASDSGSSVDKSKYSIKVTGKNGEEIKTSTGSGNSIAFRPTGDGKYTVVYSATDYAGNTKTETYTIAVGDVIKPEIIIKEGSEPVTKATLKDGTYSLKINKSDITVTDGGATLTNPTITVTVKDSTGATIAADESTEYVYTLSAAGKYSITISAKDKAGNEEIKSYTLDLSAEEVTASTTTEVFGTILLVISILVLVGVVWYFVKPAPKSKKDKKKSSDVK